MKCMIYTTLLSFWSDFSNVAEVVGFEPTLTGSKPDVLGQAKLYPNNFFKNGALSRTRTYNRSLRRGVLYPIELQTRIWS
jgi:hypothetical protein